VIAFFFFLCKYFFALLSRTEYIKDEEKDTAMYIYILENIFEKMPSLKVREKC